MIKPTGKPLNKYQMSLAVRRLCSELDALIQRRPYGAGTHQDLRSVQNNLYGALTELKRLWDNDMQLGIFGSEYDETEKDSGMR